MDSKLTRLIELSTIPELILNVEAPHLHYMGVKRTDYLMPLIKEVEFLVRHYDPSLTRFCNFTALPYRTRTADSIVEKTGTRIRYLANFNEPWPEATSFNGVAYLSLDELIGDSG